MNPHLTRLAPIFGGFVAGISLVALVFVVLAFVRVDGLGSKLEHLIHQQVTSRIHNSSELCGTLSRDLAVIIVKPGMKLEALPCAQLRKNARESQK